MNRNSADKAQHTKGTRNTARLICFTTGLQHYLNGNLKEGTWKFGVDGLFPSYTFFVLVPYTAALRAYFWQGEGPYAVLGTNVNHM